MKSVLIGLLLFTGALIGARAESLGAISLSIPNIEGWSLDADQQLPENARVMFWSNGDVTQGITLLKLPLPLDADGTVADYVPEWREGFERKASRVIDGGLLEIHGVRFGFSKIEAKIGDLTRTMKQVSTIVGKDVYVIGLHSDVGDPEDEPNFANVSDSLEVKLSQQDARPNASESPPTSGTSPQG